MRGFLKGLLFVKPSKVLYLWVQSNLVILNGCFFVSTVLIERIQSKSPKKAGLNY